MFVVVLLFCVFAILIFCDVASFEILLFCHIRSYTHINNIKTHIAPHETYVNQSLHTYTKPISSMYIVVVVRIDVVSHVFSCAC